MKRTFLILVGWSAVLLGTIGVFLPVLPTTPFLILATSCFAKSSERFHRWLLSSPLFGPIIRDWEEKHSVSPTVKRWAMCVVVLTFSISIYIVPLEAVRYFLFVLLFVCLVTIYRLPE